jgi:hypothetical protein
MVKKVLTQTKTETRTRIRPMSILSPKFFALPLIAVLVIWSLPRGQEQATANANNAKATKVQTVQKPTTCAQAQHVQNCKVSLAESTQTAVR